jgi:hypothetical protein
MMVPGRSLLVLAALCAVLSSCTCVTTPHPCAGLRASEVGGQLVTREDGSTIRAQTYTDQLVQLSRLEGPTFVEILEVRAEDDWVFFCSAVRGLHIVDASDPARMKTIRRLGSSLGSATFPRCQHLASNEAAIFMSNRGDEIQPTSFITAFDRDSGAELGSYTEEGHSFEGLAARDGHLLAAAHDHGLIVLAIGNGELTRVGSVGDIGNAWSVAVHAEHAYVASASGRMSVIDIRQPTAPQLVATLEIVGSPQSIAIDAATETAWLAAGASGLIGVSIEDPSAPVVSASADTPGSALQVSLDGSHAFVADWNDVRAFDVSDPGAVSFVASERINVPEQFPRVLGVGAANGVVFMGEWTGLYAYRFSPGKTPDIWSPVRTIDFGSVETGATATAALVLQNFGQAPLVAWDIATTGEAFSVSTTSLVLEPGAADSLEVTFAPTTSGEQSACLAVRSDDPDDQALAIQLRANLPSLGVGDPAPKLEMRLLDGGTWRLEEQRGNVVVLAYFATF